MSYRFFLNIIFVLGCSAQLFSVKNSCFDLSKEFCLTIADCNPCGCGMSEVRKSVTWQYGLTHKDFKRPRHGFTCKQCVLPVTIAAGSCCLCSEVVRTCSPSSNVPAHDKMMREGDLAWMACVVCLIWQSCLGATVLSLSIGQNMHLNLQLKDVVSKMEEQLDLPDLQCASWQSRIIRVKKECDKRGGYLIQPKNEQMS